ncbi:MAG TPA: type II toxin-antitoxin system RelE/ParE family toxin [Bacteroidales bacterium]|nr:type II toxin-antitoxin system RelE/ParE family toxin [Bacteroidales bacterium]
MAKYQLSNKAVNDLTTIWNYTLVKWSEKQADQYYNLLIDTFIEISKNPGLGKDYSDIFENILGFRVGRHIIFYRIVHVKDIEIIRILHERMDLKIRLKE